MDRNRLIRRLRDKGLDVSGTRWKILKEIGRGGNGVAVRCQGPADENAVAKLYIPPDNRDLDEQALERFRLEVALTSKLQHPNIISALGSGTFQIGAYTLPFYLMPLAQGTLRQHIGLATDSEHVERVLRIFVRASLGVACLHSHGVVHRDLKPENILMSSSDQPLIADLGIAHVNSDFVSVSMKTIESERLLNRDYYAPEQRFGGSSAADRRVDIYAMGCILYELLSGTPPVRNNSPPLEVYAEAFSVFDPIVDRMTAYDASNRYPSMEDAIEDLAVAIGWAAATMKGARAPTKEDVPTMAKLLRSSNDLHRRRGIAIARKLGNDALPILHELIGHGRRDVRNVVATAIGEVRDPSSLPFLAGALYGGTSRISRPSADTASRAIAQYAPADRLDTLNSIDRPIRPAQILEILDGVPTDEAYLTALGLARQNLILVDWTETELEVLVRIDEDRAWEDVKRLVNQRDDFKLRRVLRLLSSAHQLELVSLWLARGIVDGWFFPYAVDAVVRLDTTLSTKRDLLLGLKSQVSLFTGNLKDRRQLLNAIDAAIEGDNQAALVD